MTRFQRRRRRRRQHPLFDSLANIAVCRFFSSTSSQFPELSARASRQKRSIVNHESSEDVTIAEFSGILHTRINIFRHQRTEDWSRKIENYLGLTLQNCVEVILVSSRITQIYPVKIVEKIFVILSETKFGNVW